MKARFKTILFSALGAMTVFSAVTFSSCNEDKCKAIMCAYNGVCKDGQCLCPTGYEGNQCEIITRDRYLGVWTVTEDGTYSNAAQYPVDIVAGPNISEIRIKNFRNSFLEEVNAFVTGDTITIPDQIINNKTVRGFGFIEAEKYDAKHGKLTLRYIVTDQNGVVDDYGVDGGEPSLWNK